MRKIIKILFIINLLFAIEPEQFHLKDIQNNFNSRNRGQTMWWNADGVVDLQSGNNMIFVGTTGGISTIDLSGNNINFYSFDNPTLGSSYANPTNYISDNILPAGGNPVAKTYDLGNGETLVIHSGVLAYNDIDGERIVYGTGIAWSLDSGENWTYSSQPVDEYEVPDCSQYQTVNDCVVVYGCGWTSTTLCYNTGADPKFNWNNVQLGLEPTVVTQQNVAWDVAADIQNEYIYAANWAGKLQRIKWTNTSSGWQPVPLPIDRKFSQNCTTGWGNNYVYNPLAPIWTTNQNSGGNDNHKPFSVFVDNENNTIWVGTVKGVNKGTIDGDCIDWIHYKVDKTNYEDQQHAPFYDGEIGGDWITGIFSQDLGNNQTRIWLISREVVEPPVPHKLTYTDDDGLEWITINQFNDEGVGATDPTLVSNLYFNGHEMFASTHNGLYYTTIGNEQNWEYWGFPEYVLDNVLTSRVLTTIIYDDILFVGTANGLVYGNYTLGSGYMNPNHWTVYQVKNLAFSEMSIYPNPSSNFAKFLYKTNIQSGSVDIFDFSMEKVVSNIPCLQENNNGENYLSCIGKNFKLSNGVYFCRLSIGNSEVWEKLMIVNN